KAKDCADYYTWRKRRIERGDGGRAIDMELTTLSNVFHWAVRVATGRCEPTGQWPPSVQRHEGGQTLPRVHAVGRQRASRPGRILFQRTPQRSVGLAVAPGSDDRLPNLRDSALAMGCEAPGAGWFY